LAPIITVGLFAAPGVLFIVPTGIGIIIAVIVGASSSGCCSSGPRPHGILS
jgi:hypothetical protein